VDNPPPPDWAEMYRRMQTVRSIVGHRPGDPLAEQIQAVLDGVSVDDFVELARLERGE